MGGLDEGGPALSAREQAEYDALADLFLGEPAAPRAAAPAPQTATTSRIVAPTLSLRTHEVAPSTAPLVVEGLLLGHLPVLASAWAPQYARGVAEHEAQAVALLRVQAGQVWLDVIPAPGGERLVVDVDATRDLASAVKWAVQRAARWMIRVDEPSESGLIALGLDRVTLLTGCDEAAVVSSYRAIKAIASLVEAAGDSEESEQPDRPAGMPDLALAIMGAVDEQAAIAEDKLRRAAKSFLGREVAAALRVGKMAPSPSANVFRGPVPMPVAGLVRLVRHLTQEARAAGTAPPTPAVRMPTPQIPEVIALELPPIAMRVEAPEPREQAVRPSPSISAPAHSEPVAQPAPLAAPLPAGMAALEHRCPYAAGVTLARSPQGALALVATVHPGEAPASIAEAMKQLHVARAWSASHASLLAAAFAGVRVEPQPSMHIVLEDPADLRSLLEAGVHAHVAFKAAEGWVVRPLN